MRGVALLGATGSIGDSTLAVLALHPDRYRLEVVAARRNVPRMLEICRQFRPPLAVLTEPAAAAELRAALGSASPTRVLAGRAALEQVVRAPSVDVVVAGIVGAAGLESSLAAARAGKTLLLANKEALVMAGALFMDAVQRGGATLIPIDSETNAMFQCLPGYRCGEPAAEHGVRRLLLTASGGPFLRTSAADMAPCDARAGLRPPALGDGTQDFGRLGHADEQGPRSHRKRLAVRPARQRHRGGGASAKRGALAGRVLRRLAAGAAGQPRHAGADRPRAGLAAAPGLGRRAR